MGHQFCSCSSERQTVSIPVAHVHKVISMYLTLCVLSTLHRSVHLILTQQTKTKQPRHLHSPFCRWASLDWATFLQFHNTRAGFRSRAVWFQNPWYYPQSLQWQSRAVISKVWSWKSNNNIILLQMQVLRPPLESEILKM